MSIPEIKEKLQELISQEEDAAVLEAIYLLLTKVNQDSEMQQALTKRAAISEQQIKMGQVSDVDAVYERLKTRKK